MDAVAANGCFDRVYSCGEVGPFSGRVKCSLQLRDEPLVQLEQLQGCTGLHHRGWMCCGVHSGGGARVKTQGDG